MTPSRSDVACACASRTLASLPARTCPLSASFDLPLHERSCSAARRAVRHLLEAWEVGRDDELHDVLVVVSELVGNAVRHGDLRVALELSFEQGCLRVSVCDGGPGLPRQRDGEAQAETGRGLAIVAALTTSWGIEPLDGGGKRVWALLPLHGPGVVTHP